MTKYFNQHIVMIVFCTILLIVNVFLITWTRLKIIKVGYQINEMVKVESQYQEQNNALRLEMARLRNPERLQRLALENLNLVMPTDSQIIIVTSKDE